MELFINQVLAGIATGAIYACMALAVVMIYQAIDHLTFAQGEMAMFSTYMAWSMIHAGLPYWVAFGITLIGSFAIGVFIQQVILWPVRDAPILTLIIVFIGLLVIFNSLAGWIFSYTIKTFPSPFPSDALFSGQPVSTHDLGSIGVTLAVVSLVYVFFGYTRVVLALRA